MATSPSLSRPVLKSSLSSPLSTPHLARDLALPSEAHDHPSSPSDTAGHNGHIHFPPQTSTSADRPDRPASAKRASSFQRTHTGSSTELGTHYKARVGFDTFDDSSEDALFSFTLQCQSLLRIPRRPSLARSLALANEAMAPLASSPVRCCADERTPVWTDR